MKMLFVGLVAAGFAVPAMVQMSNGNGASDGSCATGTCALTSWFTGNKKDKAAEADASAAIEQASYTGSCAAGACGDKSDCDMDAKPAVADDPSQGVFEQAAYRASKTKSDCAADSCDPAMAASCDMDKASCDYDSKSDQDANIAAMQQAAYASPCAGGACYEPAMVQKKDCGSGPCDQGVTQQVQYMAAPSCDASEKKADCGAGSCDPADKQATPATNVAENDRETDQG